jgi:hypothetical protein
LRVVLANSWKAAAVTKTKDPAEATSEELANWNAEEGDRLDASAAPIIESENVLRLFASEISKVVAGERLNAQMLYLVATSRLFSKCMNAAIKGTSSGGKSEIRKQVLEFFPSEDVVSFTTLSERALLYYEGDFAHKILSMGEAAGTDEQSLQDYLLRELMSEGQLRYPVVQKEKGGSLSTVVIQKNGPVAFLVTTTKNALHPENETRMVSLEIDDSEGQTRAVLRKVAQVEGLNRGIATIDYEPWRDFQRWLALGERRVVVPFADTLSDLIPAASVRLRRDFGQVLRAVKAHALLHREHRDRDDLGQIEADIEHDYAAIRQLMNGLIAESSGVAVNMAVQETVDAVAEATQRMAPDDGASAQTVAFQLKLDKSAARRRLLKAASEGFVVNLEMRRGQPGRYRVTGQKPEIVDMLPPPERLAIVPPVAKSQLHTITKQNGTDGTVARVVSGTGKNDTCAHCGRPGGEVWEWDGPVRLHGGCADAYAAAAEFPDIPDFLRRVQ